MKCNDRNGYGSRPTSATAVILAFLFTFVGGVVLAYARHAEAAKRYDHAFYCQVWNGSIYEGALSRTMVPTGGVLSDGAMSSSTILRTWVSTSRTADPT